MRAVLCGYYGKGNGGDEALLASLLQMLPPHVTPVILSGDRQQTRELARIALGEGRPYQIVDRMALPTVLQTLQRSQAFIWGGGSLIQDVTSAVSPLYYGGLMALAQWFGLKTIAWAQGIGPLRRPFTRWMAQQTFSRCHAVSVRNGESAHLVAGWQVPAILAPDPVWALNAAPVPGLADLPAPRIAVNLRPHPRLTPDRLELFTQALIQFQQATDVCVLLVPFQASQDLAIAQAIQPRLPGASRIISLTNPQQLKGLFRGVEMTISMRYHGLIMAAAEGCRCFALSYDPKVSSLMDELSIPGWSLTDSDHHAPPPTTAAAISHQWLEHYANGEPLTSQQIQSLVDRALMHRDVLEGVLGKR